MREIQGSKGKKLEILISNFDRFSWIPGLAPIDLDLEKLFLLSDSMENLNLNGKTEILKIVETSVVSHYSFDFPSSDSRNSFSRSSSIGSNPGFMEIR